SEDFILFSDSVIRTLERGENQYAATLAPLGNLILLDFIFKIGSQEIRACDDERVQTTTIAVEVRDVNGGPEAMDVIDCAIDRPVPFTEQRYQAGRELLLTLRADGAHRFLGGDRFMMPDEDKRYDRPLALYAVGTTNVVVDVRTATCAIQMNDVV